MVRRGQGQLTSLVRRLLAYAVLAVLVGFAATAVAGVATGNWQIRPILSGSMRPGFPIGGVVVAERVPSRSLQVGDVAVFHPPGAVDVTYVHRIVWMRRQGDELLIRTKGDANPVNDPWTLHLRGRDAYEARFTLPLLGYAAVWLHSPVGRRDMVAVAAVAFFICLASLIVELVRRARRSSRRRPPEVSSLASRSAPHGTARPRLARVARLGLLSADPSRRSHRRQRTRSHSPASWSGR